MLYHYSFILVVFSFYQELMAKTIKEVIADQQETWSWTQNNLLVILSLRLMFFFGSTFEKKIIIKYPRMCVFSRIFMMCYITCGFTKKKNRLQNIFLFKDYYETKKNINRKRKIPWFSAWKFLGFSGILNDICTLDIIFRQIRTFIKVQKKTLVLIFQYNKK